LSASATRTPYRNTFRLSTGSTPGSPKQTGHTWLLGAAPKAVAHPQKIFEAVLS
jgi:hypothetical protein